MTDELYRSTLVMTDLTDAVVPSMLDLSTPMYEFLHVASAYRYCLGLCLVRSGLRQVFLERIEHVLANAPCGKAV